jgi:sugar phosphate isomerase/epimerase
LSSVFLLKYPNIEECLEKVAKFGYDAIDPISIEPHIEPRLWGKKQRKEFRELCESYNVKINQIATFGLEMADPEWPLREACIQCQIERLDFAYDVGAKNLEFVPGRTRADMSREKTWKWAVEGYRKVANYGRDIGIPIAVEYEPQQPHQLMWGRPTPLNVHTIEQLKKFADDVGSEYCKCNLDLGHCNISKATKDEFEMLKDYIISTHCNDNDGVTDLNAVPSRYNAPFEKYFSWLHDIGYDGYIGVELEGAEEPDAMSREAFDYLKSLLMKLGYYGTYRDPFK